MGSNMGEEAFDEAVQFVPEVERLQAEVEQLKAELDEARDTLEEMEMDHHWQSAMRVLKEQGEDVDDLLEKAGEVVRYYSENPADLSSISKDEDEA